MFIDKNIPAKFKEVPLPACAAREDAAVAIPTVRGKWFMRYGAHAYYFLNLKTQKALEVEINHLPIMQVGVGRYLRSHYQQESHIFKLKYLTRSYHYDMSLIEHLALINAPHTVTSIGQGRFMIGLWAYYGCLIVDLVHRTVTYRILDGKDDHVMGTHQWFDHNSQESFFMTYSWADSLKKIADPYHRVACRVLSYAEQTGKATTLWEGDHVDYLHDIALNKAKELLIIPEFGLFVDKNKEPIPSKALVLSLTQKKHWVIDGLRVGAHVKFDPHDDEVFYLSNHNFGIQHKSALFYLLKGVYVVNFLGPGAITKYRMTANGPQLISEFSHPLLLRAFDHEVFFHRGRKVIAIIGYPEHIFIVDANDMTLIKMIEVKSPPSRKHIRQHIKCAVGTISPSRDGEKIYAQTRYSFQIIDIATSQADWQRDFFHAHSCTNHMETSHDTDW